jgi:hypothetical protein
MFVRVKDKDHVYLSFQLSFEQPASTSIFRNLAQSRLIVFRGVFSQSSQSRVGI